MALLSILFCLLFVSCVFALDEYKIINTGSGAVRGNSNITLFDEKPYYAFRGIPYAEDPLEKLRFKVIYEILKLNV